MVLIPGVHQSARSGAGVPHEGQFEAHLVTGEGVNAYRINKLPTVPSQKKTPTFSTPPATMNRAGMMKGCIIPALHPSMGSVQIQL